MQGIAQQILANPGRYSVQELQRGVQDGVIPAYIAVPLIQEKVQQQKQMQMAQAMQQPSPQTQPSIAQQVMQEAQGVEGLPTALPQQYAGGGIVAFADGDLVEDGYSSQGIAYETPYDRMNREARERAFAEKADRVRHVQEAGGNTTPYGEQMGNVLSTLGSIPVTALKHLVGAPGYGISALLDRTPSAPAVDKDLGPVPGTSDRTPVLSGSTPPSAPSGASTGLGGASALGRAPGVGLKAPTFKTPEGESYEAGATKFYEGYGKQAATREAQAEEAKAAARAKVTGLAFDDYKKSLEQEALASGAERDQAKYMSLFKAGLAMMAGTSRHALENIGKGAMAGAEDYQSAMKDLKKADKERQKELAHIEQARRAEAMGDRDTAVKEADAARDRADARDRYVGEGIYKATGMDKAQAYDLAKTEYKEAGDIYRTNLSGQYHLAAAREAADARLAAALTRGEGRGGMNQKQIGDTLVELQRHPEAMAYSKQLLAKNGKRYADSPQYQNDMNQFVKGLFAKYYGGQMGAPASGQSDTGLQQLLSDPSIARYLKQ